MGLLSWLFGSADQKTANQPVANLPGPGTYSVDIVGESRYQFELESICGGKTDDGHKKVVEAVLIHEDSNPHDNKAVRIDIGGRTVGYLSRENAREYRKALKQKGHPGITASCSAVIVGGWDRGSRGQGHFGVKLDLPIA
jgi:hypothetical protein